jgi:hypothetical protein
LEENPRNSKHRHRILKEYNSRSETSTENVGETYLRALRSPASTRKLGSLTSSGSSCRP